ncbi:MAG: GSCFA domain-containing protein [Alistipes sp.]|nr:GSCFA domain-containing protein [Alistipes sp.]
MKFRTEVEVAPWHQKINYNDTILSLGSCFATNIAERLAERKFCITANPTGILFNPASIAQGVDRIAQCRMVDTADLFESNGRWLSYDFHSSLSSSDKAETFNLINSRIATAHQLLRSANHLIITLGTAWAYRLCSSNKVVANCHKQPHSLFRRELLRADEILEALESIVASCSAHIILTVSPIRHMGEGVEDNSLSKALLRVACEELRMRHPERVTYFPSFEIMMDDLRDYRFYGDDLVHPSTMAVDYIANKFFGAALSDATQKRMAEVAKIVNAANHRPQNPHSEQHKAFCRHQLELIEQIKDVDLQKEREYFERMLQINL